MYQIWEAIAYLASVIYAFLIYWLIRQKPLENIFVLAALLSALGHFFYQYSFRVPLLLLLCADAFFLDVLRYSDSANRYCLVLPQA